MTPARWLIAITALSLAAAGLLGALFLRERDETALLRLMYGDKHEALTRMEAKRYEAEAQVAALTSSLSAARAHLAEAEVMECQSCWTPHETECFELTKAGQRETAGWAL